MKRVSWIQKFIDELQRDKVLRSSDVFVFFFKTTQNAEFTAKKKEFQKMPGPKNYLEHKHMPGKTPTGLTFKKLEVANNLGNYTQDCLSLYNKIIVATDDTVKLMRCVSDAFVRNAELFKDMAILHSKIDSTELTDLFNLLRKISLSIGETYTKQATNIHEKFNFFFRYYREELSAIKEVITSQ
jgi:hypothetical protein